MRPRSAKRLTPQATQALRSAPMPASPPDSQAVFINTPYDRAYEPLFVTLVTSLICLGLKPRSVLEIRESGQGRLARIYKLLQSCGASIHDLSRTGTPVRFNMPFELGLACSLRLRGTPHEIVVLDSTPHRLDRTLSDYKGRDPLIHSNRCDDLVSCTLDVFQAADGPAPDSMRSAARFARRFAGDIKSQYRTATIFRPAAFRSLVGAATRHAVDKGFIPS